jgi:Domain of unknown function (DUF4145)
MRFRELTPENWREPDPTNKAFGRMSPVLGVGPRSMRGDDWARAFLAVELKQHVPHEIRELFEVARGAMLYGWFFYPMFALGEEQLYRVLEATVRARYKQIGGQKREPRFKQAIDFLIENNVIPESDGEHWHAARELRNAASHRDQHEALPPGTILRHLEVSAHDINRLFARPPKGVSQQQPQE